MSKTPKDDPVAYYTTLGLVAGLTWEDARRAAKALLAEKSRSPLRRALEKYAKGK